MAADHLTASAINRELTGQGISHAGLRAQTETVPGRAVGAAHGSPGRRDPSRGVFRAAGRGPLTVRKSSWTGAEHRRALLADVGITLAGDLGRVGANAGGRRRPRCGRRCLGGATGPVWPRSAHPQPTRNLQRRLGMRNLGMTNLSACRAGRSVALAEAGWNGHVAQGVFEYSNISIAKEFPGSQVGSQRRQARSDARPRPATVAAGRWHTGRCQATPSDRPSPYGMQEVSGSSPLSSTVFAGQSRIGILKCDIG